MVVVSLYLMTLRLWLRLAVMLCLILKAMRVHGRGQNTSKQVTTDSSSEKLELGMTAILELKTDSAMCPKAAVRTMMMETMMMETMTPG